MVTDLSSLACRILRLDRALKLNLFPENGANETTPYPQLCTPGTNTFKLLRTSLMKLVARGETKPNYPT